MYLPEARVLAAAAVRDVQDCKSDRNLLQMYRLVAEVDVLKRPEDYTEFAQLAIEAGSPGEAEQVLEKGLQKNVFTDARTRIRQAPARFTPRSSGQARPGVLWTRRPERCGAGARPARRTSASGSRTWATSSTTRRSGPRRRAHQGRRAERGRSAPAAGHRAAQGGQEGRRPSKAFKAVKGDPNLERIANLWSLHARQA